MILFMESSVRVNPRNPHGLDWPWAFPRKGVTGATERIRPLLDFRAAHEKTDGFGRRSRSLVLIIYRNSKALNQPLLRHTAETCSLARRARRQMWGEVRATPPLKISSIQRPTK